MKKKLLKLHKEWLQRGQLTTPGLCSSLPEEYMVIFGFLYPTVEERELLQQENKPALNYWGCGESFENIFISQFPYTYTPLRQSLVLLLAEMIEDPFFTDKTE